MDAKYRSRKWILTNLILAVTSVGLFSSKLDGGDFASIIMILAAAYPLANAFEKSKWGGSD